MSIQERVQQLLSANERVTESTGVKKNKLPITMAVLGIVLTGSFMAGMKLDDSIQDKRTPQSLQYLQMSETQAVDQVVIRKQDDYFFTSKQISQALPFKAEISALFNATLDSNVENIFLTRLEIIKSIHKKIVEIDQTLDSPITDNSYENLSRYRISLNNLDSALLSVQSSEQVMDLLPILKQMAANEIYWDIDKKIAFEEWIDPDTGMPFSSNTKHSLSVDLDEPTPTLLTPKL